MFPRHQHQHRGGRVLLLEVPQETAVVQCRREKVVASAPLPNPTQKRQSLFIHKLSILAHLDGQHRKAPAYGCLLVAAWRGGK